MSVAGNPGMVSVAKWKSISKRVIGSGSHKLEKGKTSMVNKSTKVSVG